MSRPTKIKKINLFILNPGEFLESTVFCKSLLEFQAQHSGKTVHSFVLQLQVLIAVDAPSNPMEMITNYLVNNTEELIILHTSHSSLIFSV